MEAESKKYPVRKASDAVPEIFGLPLKAAGVLLGSLFGAAMLLIVYPSWEGISGAICVLGFAGWYLHQDHYTTEYAASESTEQAYTINDL